MKPYYEDDQGVTLYHGDCIEVMRSLPDNSVHAVVTDPPYGLEFMGKEWDGADGFRRSLNLADAGRDSVFGRTSAKAPEYKTGKPASSHAEARIRRADEVTPKGQGHTTSAGAYLAAGVNGYSAGLPFQQWCEVWAAETLRVLKPGGYMVAFGGSRTWHRLAVAVEDAGFEIRDSIAWLYGSGFPKGVNLTGEFEGWGTGLKPAFEPIVVGRKPFKLTVAENMAEHGTAAININATRVEDDSRVLDPRISAGSPDGRWPTNVLLERSQGELLDTQTGVLTSGIMRAGQPRAPREGVIYGKLEGDTTSRDTFGDSGGASRFFPTFHYEAKAPGAERPDVDGVQHPTVKPLDLMRWLVRLVASPGATILEPFAGSGTTLEACLIEGFNVIGIEREETYLPLIMQRVKKPLQQSLFGDWDGAA